MHEEILANIIRREGTKFTNHPRDRGGPTKFGITLRTLRQHKRRATASDVQALTHREAEDIYRADYIAPFEWIKDEFLLDLVVDAAVHHGVRRSTKWLQLAAGTAADGRIGPKTKRAVNRANNRSLSAIFLMIRQNFLMSLMIKPSQAQFARGWHNRLAKQVREWTVRWLR